MDLYKIKNELLNGKSIFDIKLNVVFYARVSTESKEQALSLDNQVKYFKDFIKKNKNWIYIGGYVDEAVSGTSVKKRQNFLKMIEDAKNSKFDLIITKEISRFSRNTLDSIKYTQMLLKYGVGVFFQSDNINTLMPDSELRLTIMSGIAQDEVRRVSERVKFGLKQSIKEGRMLGSAPFGYTKKNGILKVKDDEARIVKKIFDYYTEGLGIRHISKKLADEKLFNSSGKPFTFSTIRGIITNPKYKGYYCGNKYYSIDFRYGKKKMANENEWIIKKDENVPAIISESKWDKANKILKERSISFKENKSSYSNRYFFSGKIICFEHNSSFHRIMYGKNEAYRCNRARNGCNNLSIYKAELEHILNGIYNLINKNKSIIASYFDKLSKSENNASKIEKILKKKEKLFELIVGDFISNEEFKKRNEKLDDEIKALSENEVIFSKGLFLNDDFDEFKNTDYIKFKNAVVKRCEETYADIDIYLAVANGTKKCVSLHETGISQAQVSRLEKSAIDRMKKYV